MKKLLNSSGNGHQAKTRAPKILRSAQDDMNARLDRAVALADSPLGASLIPTQYPVGLPQRPASEGARGMPSGMGDAGVTAPLRPAPVPGSVNAGILRSAQNDGVARGEFSATFGVSGTPITSGFLLDLGEYNPELMGRNAVPIYEKMRRSDAQVRATLMACKLPVLSAKWEVMPADLQEGSRQKAVDSKQVSTGAGKATAAKAKEIAEFVKANLFGGLEFKTSTGGWVSQTWQSVISNALLMLDFGCAVHEDVYAVDGDAIHLRSLPGRLPLTFYRWHTEADGETLLALEQYGYRGNQFLNVLLPADKIARFTYQQEGANFWGIALQRAMYPHWYIKSKLYRIDAIANERNALGIPVFRLSPGFAAEDKAAAYSFVTQLAAHEAAGLVEPPGDPHTGLRIAGYQGNLRDVMPSIQHHNEMISRAALNTFMDLGQAAHGSRALGASATDFFMLGLQSIADQIAQDITATTIRRLVALNFGDEAPCPRLIAANVQARSIGQITADLVALAQQGLVVSEKNIRKAIRERFALPEETSESVVVVRGETVTQGETEAVGKGWDAPGD
ncbi:MAG: phage portal protein family protein [Candidatus Acidiferrales bacterium]